MSLRALGALILAVTFSGQPTGSRGTQAELLAHARELREKGELDAAQALLEPLRADPEVATRAEVISLLARIAWSRGDADRALRTFVEAEHLARAASLHALAAGNAIARADTLRRHRGDLGSAREALRMAEADLIRAPEVASHHAYQRALVERDAGQLREAERFFDMAGTQAKALGQHALWVDVEQVRAPIAFALGQEQHALTRLRELAASEAHNPCRRAHLMTNLGWLSLIAAESGAGAPDYAAMNEGHRLYRTTCPSSTDAANASLNLALSDLATGKLESARTRLRTIAASGGDAPVLTAAYAAVVNAELEAEAGRAEPALQLYMEFLQRAELSAVPHSLRHRVALARGRLLQRLGRRAESLRVYRDGELELEQALEALPFGVGLDAYVGAQEAGAYALMELLAEANVAEAFDVARRARTRVLRSLSRSLDLGRLELSASAEIKRLARIYEAARTELDAADTDAWQVPLDELPARTQKLALLRRQKDASLDALLAQLPARPLARLNPDGDELVLGLFQAASGIRVFAMQHGKVSTRLVARPAVDTLQAWSDALLSPFSMQIARASSASVISDAALESLNVHALPFRGEPLLQHMPVTYRVDVHPDVSPLREGRVLITADARSDLPLAAADGRALRTLLSGSQPTRLLAQAAASSREVSRALRDATTFYFAGHSEQPGSSAFSAALLLADGTRLEALDVLSLSHAPERVVLSSCESAQAKSRARATGLGIAQAFVLRGAKVVLGTTHTVSDELAARLGQVLREDAAPVFDAQHFRRALLSLRAQATDKTNEWMSYRMLVP